MRAISIIFTGDKLKDLSATIQYMDSMVTLNIQGFISFIELRDAFFN